MDWTDCPIIEVVPGRMSGAPVLRNTRVRPQDLIANIDQGAKWLADAHGIELVDVQVVLAFYHKHHRELPEDYISPERAAASRRHAAAI